MHRHEPLYFFSKLLGMCKQIIFFLSSFHEKCQTDQPNTISCHFVAQDNYSGALSHTLTMSPRKHVRMHNPAMNIALHLKKKPTLNDDEHS